ncbi:hypothetical protein AAMO2058_000971900 [Amorphochlora amoebiformis]|mmetsp:Transcript_23032/g.36191  ORF Transcript_23032/g.36191 Transcript_23032/m.36191 type:complete len:368 (-) Transcript_23032:83-1186(-)
MLLLLTLLLLPNLTYSTQLRTSISTRRIPPVKGVFDKFFGLGRPQRTKLGSLDVSPMGVGTWAWGNRLLWGYEEKMDDELGAVFELLVANGINLFDTGDSYGTGKLEAQSEKLLGRFISELPEGSRKDIHVATKLATYPWRVTSSQFVNAAKASRERVGGRLAMGQLHWSASNYAPWQERALWDGLCAMHEQQVVEEVGASNYGPKQMRRLSRYLSKAGIPLASNQVQFSLLSRRMDCKEANDEEGVVTIAYSPLCLGLLTGKYSETNLPKSQVRRQLFKSLLPRITPLLDELNAVADFRGKTMSQVAINWCMAKGCIPIPGAKDLNQARENLGALGWELTPGEVESLERAAEKVSVQTVQNIFMTS